MTVILHEPGASALGASGALDQPQLATAAPRARLVAQAEGRAYTLKRSAVSAIAQQANENESFSGATGATQGLLGTSANKGATPSQRVVWEQRRRLDAMRRLSSKWLIGEAMGGRENLQHYEGDLFLDRSTGQIVESKFVRPPRVASCMWSLGQMVTIDVNDDHGTARFGDIQTCASIWSCPHCATTIRRNRAREIARAVEVHQNNGGHLAFLTLTLRHDSKDELVLTLDTIMDGWKNLTRNRAWRDLKSRVGIVGFIRATEVTYSERNGWHPHAHVLIFLDKNNPLTRENKKMIEEKIFAPWSRWCKNKTGKEPLREYGLDLQLVDTDGKVLSEYLSKMQLADAEQKVQKKRWGVSAELARMDIKKGKRESLLPFSLLEEGTGLYVHQRYRLWLEYVKATKGRRAITWSRGLKDSLNVLEISDEDILEAETLGSVSRYLVAARRYQSALRLGSVPEILEAAEEGRWGEINQMIPGFLLHEVST